MTRDEFEQRILSLWMTTRMPLTRANLQFVTGVPRGKLEKWLDQLVAEGVADVDADDDGEMIWTVRGAARAGSGPTKPEDIKKLADLKQEVAAATAATALVKYGGAAARSLVVPRGDHKKSVVASGVLSFFFGPLGWLYAGSLKEAGAAGAAWILLWLLLPHWAILAPLWLTAMAVSGGLGILYARKFNEKGDRASLFPSDDGKALPPKRP